MGARVVAALLSLVYAGWALTARRGIFADFSAGRSISSADAKTSDTIDVALLIVASAAVMIAIALWVWRRVRRAANWHALEIGGIALAVVGVATVVVGLFLAGAITDAASQAAQGDKGVTASLVLGAGFVVLALGLLLGSTVVRGTGQGSQPGAPVTPSHHGYRTW